MISQGQLIKEDSSLENQGLKHGSQIMTLVITSGPEEMGAFETNNAVLSKTRRDVAYLSGKNNEDGDFYLQVHTKKKLTPAVSRFFFLDCGSIR